MDLLGRVAARRSKAIERRSRAWPVGLGTVPFDGPLGHSQDEFSPESYGSYLATSNDIYSAASLRARLMSTLRLRLYTGDDESKKAKPNHPASQLLRYVNPFWTSPRLARMDELCMCIWGQTCWVVERSNDAARRPLEIWWAKPSRMRPVPDAISYLDGWLYDPPHGGGLLHFEPDEVIWFRYPNPLDEFAPLSPLAAARLAADTASAMMQANKKIFDNGLTAAGVIIPPAGMPTFSDEQATDLELFLQRRLSGADKAHRWAIMRFEAQFKALQVTAKDAEYVSGLGLTLRAVGNAYGIPIPLLNDLSAATLANVDALTKVLWAHTLVPDSQLQAAEVVEQYLPMFGRGAPDHAEYDYGAVPALQEAASAVWARDAQQMDRLAITINEWRARNGMPSVKWGDRPWAPLNKAQIGEDGTLQMPGTDPRLQSAIDSVLAEMGGDGGAEGGEATLDEVAALPDDERLPANQPVRPRMAPISTEGWNHLQSRQFLAAAKGLADAISLPGRVNGHHR